MRWHDAWALLVIAFRPGQDLILVCVQKRKEVLEVQDPGSATVGGGVKDAASF